MAKSPLGLADEFITPAIDAKHVKINDPQRDIKRTAVAPTHKEKPLTKTKYAHSGFEGDEGTKEDRYFHFREQLEKEMKDRFAADPNAVISLSALKKQYGDDPSYSWNTLPGNHIVRNGETYYYGDNAADLDKRIDDYETPYDEKLLKRIDELGLDPEHLAMFQSIIKRNTQQGGEFDDEGNFKVTNEHAFPEHYYGRDDIRRRIRKLKKDKKYSNVDDKGILTRAILDAQKSFDDVPELPLTKEQWEQLQDEQWDETNPNYRGHDPWDNVYDALYDAYENEGRDPTPASRWYDMKSYSDDDRYVYGVGEDEEGEYGYPAYRFREPEPEHIFDFDAYFNAYPRAEIGDFLEEIYWNGGGDMPDLFEKAVREAEDSGNFTYHDIAKGIYEIDDELLYDQYNDILDEAKTEAVDMAVNRSYSYEDAYNWLRRNAPYIEEYEIEELLNDAGLYSEDFIREQIEDFAGSYDKYDMESAIDGIKDDLRYNYGIEDVDDSLIEDILTDLGFEQWGVEDFTEYLLNNATDIGNAGETLYDIIEQYGSSRLPEDQWDKYVKSLENPGGFERWGYNGRDLSSVFGRDFARVYNRGAADPRNYFADFVEDAPNNVPDEFREYVDAGTSYRDQVRRARELVKKGIISNGDALRYITAYTSLWDKNGLNPLVEKIILEEWGK